MKRLWFVCSALVGLAWALGALVTAQTSDNRRQIVATSLADLRAWDGTVDRLSRDGDLRLVQQRTDPLVPSRAHERFTQSYRGVRVFGGDITRQTENGLTTSIFGTLYEGITIDTAAKLGPAEARVAIARLSGVDLPDNYEPELVVLPKDEGGYALAYRGRAFGDAGLFVYFIDASTGSLLLSYSDLKTQSAVGKGAGVLGDTKKLSVHKVTSGYRTEDELRPPTLVTFDMKSNLTRTRALLAGTTTPTAADLGTDSDNTWTDPAVVDAHAYSGWVYDYMYKRFGRRGLDDANIPVLGLVHPADRSTVLQQTPATIGTFYLNAFYAGGGVMVFGEGLPSNLTFDGQHWNYLSGALDVFAHELTHGVTDFSSGLVYRNESGALNEAFSDMIGVSAEFYFQPPGNGPLQADYMMGEDVITPGGVRSIANPGAYGDPNHYSHRYTGTDDNGGVHTNSAIASYAFYLAIEGGVNSTSGLAVTGVGGARREQIEKAFYRAFTQLLPSTATFAVARAATIQSARDLYGADSAAARAIAEAWTAVGVN
jgi:bacillolysin